MEKITSVQIKEHKRQKVLKREIENLRRKKQK